MSTCPQGADVGDEVHRGSDERTGVLPVQQQPNGSGDKPGGGRGQKPGSAEGVEVSHMRKDYGGFVGLAFVLGALLAAGFWVLTALKVVGRAEEGIRENMPTQSWDQENLKRNDHGCPSAIYIAPGGELHQCMAQTAENLPHEINLLTQPPGYDTIEKAVIVGFKVIAEKPSSQYYEWGGLIVKNANGQFRALSANTSFGGDHVNIRGDELALGEVVGSYHTHPCLPGHFIEYFSPPDLLEPLFFHLATFMGDFCTGNVHEFLPGDKPDEEHPLDHGHTGEDIFLTKGRIIGQFTTPHQLTVVE